MELNTHLGALIEMWMFRTTLSSMLGSRSQAQHIGAMSGRVGSQDGLFFAHLNVFLVVYSPECVPISTFSVRFLDFHFSFSFDLPI